MHFCQSIETTAEWNRSNIFYIEIIVHRNATNNKDALQMITENLYKSIQTTCIYFYAWNNFFSLYIYDILLALYCENTEKKSTHSKQKGIKNELKKRFMKKIFYFPLFHKFYACIPQVFEFSFLFIIYNREADKENSQ